MILGDKWYLTMSISIIWHVLIKSFYHFFLSFPFSGQWNSANSMWGSAKAAAYCRRLRACGGDWHVEPQNSRDSMVFMVDFMGIQWEFRLKSPWNHHEITKLCGLHWIHSDRAVKPMRARRLSQRCRVAVWFGFCRKFMLIKGYDLYDYSHVSKSYVDDHLWL